MVFRLYHIHIYIYHISIWCQKLLKHVKANMSRVQVVRFRLLLWQVFHERFKGEGPAAYLVDFHQLIRNSIIRYHSIIRNPRLAALKIRSSEAWPLIVFGHVNVIETRYSHLGSLHFPRNVRHVHVGRSAQTWKQGIARHSIPKLFVN